MMIIGDKILMIKLALEKRLVCIISMFAPNVGLDKDSMRQFWHSLE